MRKLLLAAGLVLVSGCAASNLRADFEPKHLGPGEAAVIISVTNQAAYRLGGCNNTAPAAVFAGPTPYDWLTVTGNKGTWVEPHLLNPDGYNIGRVALIGVPPGTWRLDRIEIDCILVKSSTKSVPALAFTANAGEVVYVGNLDSTVEGDRAHVTTSNQWPRDSASVREKWPNLPLDAVVVRLLARPAGPDQRP